MKKAGRWIGNLLLLTGVCLIVWQLTGAKQTEKVREQQLDAFANLKAQAEADEEQTDPPATAAVSSTASGTTQPKGENGEEMGEVVGVLAIPQVDIHAPVAYGATPEILDKGFGAIPGDSAPGVQEGSYAIAGHQSHVFGQFFNRLDELETGSRFEFETLEETQTYEVYNVRIVEPEEVEAIAEEPGIAKLSLVTCYPQNSTKHRLIVMAKRVD